jgi:asparagine synthetase B (glutamine-hydrolysing)
MSCAKIKDKNLDFFTISYGGPEDESALAQKLDSLLSKPVEVLKISPPESFMKQLRRLLLITQSPYSDIEGLTHLSYFESIRDHGCRTLILGFGADLTFGGTPYEYPAFARDLLIRGRFLSAYRVFLAYLSGTRGETKTVYSVFAFLLFVYYEIFRRLIPDAVISRMRRRVAALRADDFHTLTNVPMKAPAQGEKAGYQEALKKAYGDSALRQLSQILYAFGISPVYPYEGKGFANLAKKCDPLIFAYNENKYCIRYALSQHLPKEILANKKKFGNAGFERELFDENKYEILNYVRTARATKKNSIVNIPALEEALTQDIFTDNVFRAINLLLFEDIVREHEIELSFCEN